MAPRSCDRGSWPGAVGNFLAGAASKSAAEKFQPRQVSSQRANLFDGVGDLPAYLNGQRVGNDILASGWTDYRKRIVIRCTTSLLRCDRERTRLVRFSVEGGTPMPGWLQTRYNFGPPPVRLLVQLEVEYSDGTRDSVLSDETWKATQSPIPCFRNLQR